MGVNNKKLTTEEFKKEVFNIVGDEYEVLGEYVKTSEPIEMKHNVCDKKFDMRPRNFLRLGNRCPHCSGRKKKTHEQFIQEVFDLVGDEYSILGTYTNNKAKLPIRHNTCGNEWECTPSWFLKGTRCPKCQHGSSRKTTEEFKKEVFDLVGDEYIIKSTYETCHTKMNILHTKCGNIYETTPHNFLNNRRCPYCTMLEKDSKLVKEVIKFFDDNNIKYIRECYFEDFVNKINQPFKFDFYLEDYELLIEVDGEQHFRPFHSNIDKFNRTRENDNKRNQYCLDNDLSLMRISYKHEKNIKDILTEIFINESSTTIESNNILFIDNHTILCEDNYYK